MLPGHSKEELTFDHLFKETISQKLTFLGFDKIPGTKNGVQDIVLEERKPTARHELFLWEQKTFCSMPDDMRSFYLSSNGFNLTWSAKVDTSVIPVGKMWLNKIQNVTRLGGTTNNQSGPSLADLESDSDSDIEDDNIDPLVERRYKFTPSFNIHKCHLFELDPCSGLGKVCLVYNHHEPNAKPSIWFLDRALRWHYLAESFTAYYRLMLVHLGLPQWQYTFTDIGLSSQAKQWFHIFAPVRLELSMQSSNRLTESSDLEHNKLDCDRLFQLSRSSRKKAASSNSSTTVSSGISQTSSTQSNTTSSLAKKKLPPTYTQKNSASLSKYNGSSTFTSNRLTQMK